MSLRSRTIKAGRRYRKLKAALSRERRRKKLRLDALAEARRCVGIMEHGGNNAGTEVSKIIHENKGTGPEPWCGDFMAHCYRKAGSKAVTRAWASVSLLLGVAGLKRVKSPLAGDLVVYKFDHVGMVEKVISKGVIQTIEGNTGASGAVSDSTTGGDGVYRKCRDRGLILHYIRVTR